MVSQWRGREHIAGMPACFVDVTESGHVMSAPSLRRFGCGALKPGAPSQGECRQPDCCGIGLSGTTPWAALFRGASTLI